MLWFMENATDVIKSELKANTPDLFQPALKYLLAYSNSVKYLPLILVYMIQYSLKEPKTEKLFQLVKDGKVWNDLVQTTKTYVGMSSL